MVEQLDSLIIKNEPFYAVEEPDLLNGIGTSHFSLGDSDLRTLCLNRLGLCEETVALLEAQQIDVECLKKMRFEDVDTLFDGRPLGPKIHFREALLSWRIDIGLPMKSLRMISYRKRSIDQLDTRPIKYSNSGGCEPMRNASIMVETSHRSHKAPPNISYKTFSWPMTVEVLKDILNSSNVGRMILHSGELGSLEKSFQSQLTAIVIDYHMEFDTKITAMQLENYQRCITTLFPHENKNSYHIPRGPTRRNPGGSLYSRFINQKISKKALAIGSGLASPFNM
ncbi:uncharacterized protein LOC109420870 [Aedes albopictus]|uniref:SAM domain-containing protein n=1 Tax=Aedes albopictus TaxID=7160 RepID=A0A023ENF4_AEDAL|nr:uncharacterized protein LOC109401030 [Aedes albopictus]XP_019550900.1 uncharacterized protein LOC109420870 [Aedes albopictus]KXJ70140.1 hypothetical protein RP20_CCG024676 [Aedes albopictus]